MLVRNQTQPRSTTATTTLPDGWVSVADYGAVGDGVTDDSAAFKAAIATTKHVYIPCGNLANRKHYLISQELILNESQEVRMDTTGTAWFALASPWNAEWATPMTYIPTCILTTCLTTNTFTLNKRHSVLRGVYIRQKIGTTPTAGFHISFGSWTNRCYSTAVIGCVSEGGFQGVQAYGQSQFSILQDIMVKNSLSVSLQLDIPAPWGDLQWSNVTLTNDTRLVSTPVTTGFYVRNIDTSRIIGMCIKGHTVQMNLAGDHNTASLISTATSPGVYHLRITGLDLENYEGATDGEGIIFGGGTYPVQRNHISSFHIYSGRDVKVSMKSNSEGNILTTGKWGSARYIDAGVRNSLHNITFNHALGASSTPAITLSGLDGEVSSNSAIEHSVGIVLSPGANYNIISNNNVRNCATPFALDAAAKATGRGVGNIGIADW